MEEENELLLYYIAMDFVTKLLHPMAGFEE
jgi:hypothetical protein